VGDEMEELCGEVLRLERVVEAWAHKVEVVVKFAWLVKVWGVLKTREFMERQKFSEYLKLVPVHSRFFRRKSQVYSSLATSGQASHSSMRRFQKLG
jgi:hypothetical protein